MNRLFYIDNLSGLFILLVVLGHTLSFLGFGDIGFYFYFLPFFFFKSGFLSKNKKVSTVVRGGKTAI